MRRLLLVLVLPVVWVPLLAVVVMLAPAVPWYGWIFAVLFWGLLLRRRRQGAGDAGVVDPAGLRPSPIRGGWM